MFFLTIILLLSGLLFASERKSNEGYQFRQFTIKEGLSQSALLSAMQDKQGFMWFGTANGLNRFDGYNFVIYINNPYDSTSISDNEITSIFEDAQGYIWIGTIKGILNKFNRKTGTFEHFIPDNISEKTSTDESYTDYPISFVRNSSSSITSIADGRDGNLWIGTWGNGLYKFNKKTNEFERYYNEKDDVLSISSNRIAKVIADKKGIVWVGTYGGGLNRVVKIQDSNKKKYFGFFHYKKNNNDYSLSSNNIISVLEDHNADIWIGTDGGLNKLSDSEKFVKSGRTKFTRYLTNDSAKVPYRSIMAIIEGNDGDLWLGTMGEGLIKFDPATNSLMNFKHNPFEENTLPDNDVLVLQKDKSGILWIGTSLGGGVSQLQVNKKKFNHINQTPGNRNSLSDNVIWSITEDKEGYIWFGTYRGGLNRYDKQKKKFVTYKHDPNDPNSLPDNHVRSLAVDNLNNLWVGCFEGGLGKLNKKTGGFFNLSKMGINKKVLGSGPNSRYRYRE